MEKLTRRQLLSFSAVVIGVSPMLAVTQRIANAAEAPKVDPNAPQARALSYVHQSPDSGRKCANCQLYKGGSDAAWGPCAIFPGKQVAAEGWCSAWVR